jgi:drug/metabolite transporter (DMT)-like permease
MWLGEVPTPLQVGGAFVVLAGVSVARLAGGRQRGVNPGTQSS